MKTKFLLAASPFGTVRGLIALICSLLIAGGDSAIYAQPSPQEAAPAEQAAKIPNDQLDSLVAPIALYPDPLLAQMLAASTYPLEVMQLQQWLMAHKELKDKALTDAVKKQDWDPSVQGLAALPDAVKQLSENIKWTTELGNAFLAQQGDVMDAVQRMRQKAQGAGTLKTNEQQKVETKVVEKQNVIVIEPANPQVVYVPSYNPTVVYGPPVYPYPPIVYPPPPPPGAYIASAAISFGVGMAVGAAINGGWGYNAGWGGGGNNTININNSNNFVNNSNRVNGGNRNNINSGNKSWQHNPSHRGGTPYGNQATANRFNGANGGANATSRQAGGRQNQGQAAAGSRQQAGASSRPSASTANRGGGGGGGSADRVGDRSVSGGGSSSRGGGFGGGSSGSSARANSSRGSSSMGSRSSGGGSRGGGGGGSRGGGRRR
jgi:hypothetical protein